MGQLFFSWWKQLTVMSLIIILLFHHIWLWLLVSFCVCVCSSVRETQSTYNSSSRTINILLCPSADCHSNNTSSRASESLRWWVCFTTTAERDSYKLSEMLLVPIHLLFIHVYVILPMPLMCILAFFGILHAIRSFTVRLWCCWERWRTGRSWTGPVSEPCRINSLQ